MWCIEAKAKIDIPLIDDPERWSNQQLRNFINEKRSGCSEFDKALNWLGERNYKEAISECTVSGWLEWLKNNLPKSDQRTIKAGETITVTHGRNEKYALWFGGVWDLNEMYVGETIRVISEN